MPQSALERLSQDAIIICFDYGLARIGVAVGNMLTKTARPLRIISWKTNEQKWKEITSLLSEWTPAAIVVGVPRHADGEPNAMTATCQKFANQLEGRFHLPVVREDERFSSVEAERENSGADYIDDEAAAVILEQWLRRKEQ